MRGIQNAIVLVSELTPQIGTSHAKVFEVNRKLRELFTSMPNHIKLIPHPNIGSKHIHDDRHLSFKHDLDSGVALFASDLFTAVCGSNPGEQHIGQAIKRPFQNI